MLAKLHELADLLAEYEGGRLPEEEVLALFQYLVNTGLAWQLQGCYGRTARDLLQAGLVRPRSEGPCARG